MHTTSICRSDSNPDLSKQKHACCTTQNNISATCIVVNPVYDKLLLGPWYIFAASDMVEIGTVHDIYCALNFGVLHRPGQEYACFVATSSGGLSHPYRYPWDFVHTVELQQIAVIHAHGCLFYNCCPILIIHTKSEIDIICAPCLGIVTVRIFIYITCVMFFVNVGI
jgi:hypothetical protein